MIYLNIDYLDKYKTEGFLSHELQHMIYWNEKTRVSGVSDDI
jgi:predicted SprT family Zn-dependent metalloprotease